MKNRILSMLLPVVIVSTLLSACGTSSQTGTTDSSGAEKTETAADKGTVASRELRMSLPVPEGTDSYNQAVTVKEYIETKTNGELTVTIYPANTLGDWTQVFDELMMGSIDMAISNSPDTYNPILGVVSLGYLTYDYDNCRKVFAPDSFLSQEVAKAMEEIGIKFFGFSFSGFDGIGTRNEIQNATEVGADKNCLIRVPSLDGVKYPAEYLGFRTSSIPYTDTYSSIQTGVVDGWVGAPPYQHYLGFRDVENYYYAYNSLQETFNCMMSMSTWDTLSEEQRTIVREAMELAASTSIDDAEKGDQLYMKMMEEEGITVVQFDSDQLEAFATAVRENVWPKLASLYGEEFMAQLNESLK
ncbi:MAG: TRAP transporter substrate-binding protein DctP [Clostridiales bacterium]|nr:TRAP transporter substrate-binding protein DctP [Clostridiales bacterium]